MPDIQSIVVVDLETTGLPSLDHNRTKITELALVACEKEHLLLSETFPRVLHKFVVCVNPLKKIQPGATQFSGLDNILLEHSQPFGDDVVECLKIILQRLPPPVCLIAHNGNKFDFPIMRKEISKCKRELPGDILCADSLLAFRHLYPRPVKTPPRKQVNDAVKRELGNKDIDEMCVKAYENCGNDTITKITPVKMTMKQINETTPRSKIKPRKIFPDALQPTVKDTDSSSSKVEGLENYDVTHTMTETSRKFLEEFLENGKTPETPVKRRNQPDCVFTTSYPDSHKLSDIYFFLHKKNFLDAHRAENDTMALLSCIAKSGENFINWINENAIPFNEIQPLA